MIELIAIAAWDTETHMRRLRMEREKEWNKMFFAAPPEIRAVMLDIQKESREREEREERERAAERNAERRHREQINAQERVAQAIRFAAIMKS